MQVLLLRGLRGILCQLVEHIGARRVGDVQIVGEGRAVGGGAGEWVLLIGLLCSTEGGLSERLPPEAGRGVIGLEVLQAFVAGSWRSSLLSIASLALWDGSSFLPGRSVRQRDLAIVGCQVLEEA